MCRSRRYSRGGISETDIDVWAGTTTETELGDYAWYNNNGSKSNEVKTKEANGYGLYDMSGNVYEWCWDWYDDSYYSTSPETDPRGADSGSISNRVRRGGDWRVSAKNCRASYRRDGSPGSRFDNCGFRVVRTAQ